ncbi:MAG TPA: hypothetical protein VKT78_08400 [Fimbriimonadaceae bacterium]|nr:hypothetical protein [Fimbriimonadaceae bacterium]
MRNIFDSLFVRSLANPILTADMWPYPCHSVFNPAATMLPDGTTLLLCRVEDQRGISHLTAARSANGVDGWVIDNAPTLVADPENYPEELWGIEDPRITYVEDLKRYVVAYTAFTKTGPGVSLALTEDFETFERYGLTMQPNDKDAALFPRKFGKNYALVHRPVTDMSADMWISYSPDLKNWGGHHLLLPARRGAWWDANKIGLCCPPIETKRGWIMLYHGVRHTASSTLYRLGAALFDLKRPDHGLLRGDSWMFGPKEPYELMGDVPNVVFPCGFTLGSDGDTLHMYYGAADTCIALATTSVTKLLQWLDDHGTDYIGIAGQPAERSHFVAATGPGA